jgi:hypothetical protein
MFLRFTLRHHRPNLNGFSSTLDLRPSGKRTDFQQLSKSTLVKYEEFLEGSER